MKVVLTLDVNEYERFVVAKYFAVAATTPQDRARTRATRHQMRRFTMAALRRSVKDIMRDLPPRAHSHATRLADGRTIGETLPAPTEHQRSLQW